MIAPSIHRPLAARRISAAKSAPVPRALVRIRASPGCSPPLRRTRSLAARPLITKPSASSGHSLVWPPARLVRASRNTSFAPRSICRSSASDFVGALNGIPATASADCGVAPIANTSPRAWFAAIWPNRYGSSTMAGKKSTDCTSAWPGGTSRIAASSRALRPAGTSSRQKGSIASSAPSRAVAPSLDAQPLQRMSLSGGAGSPGASAGAAGGAAEAGSMAGKRWNLSMKRRSIQSFQRQTQPPSTDQAPREATA